MSGCGCSVPGCTNRSSPSLKLYTFPRDPERRRKWEAKVKRTASDWMKVCEVHFSKDLFEPRRPDKKLKRTAVPNLHLGPVVKKTEKFEIKRLADILGKGLFDCDELDECESTPAWTKTVHAELTERHEPSVEREFPDRHEYQKEIYLDGMVECILQENSSSVNDGSDDEAVNSQMDYGCEENECNKESFNEHNYSAVLSHFQDYPTPEDYNNIERERQQQQMSQLESRFTDVVKMNAWLKRKVKHLHNEVSRMKKRCKAVQDDPVLKKIFRPDQISALRRQSNNGQAWSAETVQHALQLRFSCGLKGYSELLKAGYPLPSLRTLREKSGGTAKRNKKKRYVEQCLSIGSHSKPEATEMENPVVHRPFELDLTHCNEALD